MGALTLVVLAWSGSLGAVAAWAGLRTRRSGTAGAEQARYRARSASSILLLRPCAGTEPCLDEALRSSGCAPHRTRIRFLVACEADAATVWASLASGDLACAGHDVRVVITRAHAPNLKAAQLARALELEPERADVVVVADSDVALTAGVLSALLAPLEAGEAQASWVPTVETRPSTRADRASARVLDASLHSFPLLAGIDPGGMVGKVSAVRRDALDAVGGFAGLVEHLGEDVELSRRLRGCGLRVRACPAVAASLASGRSWAEVVDRYARWIAVVRAQRAPLLVSYPLLLAATPLILALGWVALAFEGERAAAAIAVALVVRSGIAALACRRAGRPVRPGAGLVDGLMADSLLLVAFACALARQRIVWRGVGLELAARGRLRRARGSRPADGTPAQGRTP
jgi:ceramide glucosyltransferase